MSEVIVTGAFGLVGSAIVEALNKRGIVPKVIDRWDNPDKWRNVRGLRFDRINTNQIFSRLGRSPVIIHCAASVNTKEPMSEDLWKNNVDWTLELRRLAGKFICMSSMSVYGNSADMTERLDCVPLCPYALTKLAVDQALFGGKEVVPNTYALRLSNVYGKREQHKGDMASLVTKGLLKKSPLYQPKQEQGARYEADRDDCGNLGNIRRIDTKAQETHWQLFAHPSGETIKRDFLFADDIAQVVLHFLNHDSIPSGIYNLGHGGEPRSFEDLVTAVEKLPIEYVPLPDSLKNQYQHYTKADITKLRDKADYHRPFTSLEDGIEKTRAWMKEEGLIA